MINIGQAPKKASKRITTLGGLLQIIRMGYSNYLSYIISGLTFLNTSYLILLYLGVKLSFELFSIFGVSSGILIIFLIGMLHYRKGFYEGQINVDIYNNPYHRRIIPGKEEAYVRTFLMLMLSERNKDGLTSQQKEELDRLIIKLEELIKGETVSYD